MLLSWKSKTDLCSPLLIHRLREQKQSFTCFPEQKITQKSNFPLIITYWQSRNQPIIPREMSAPSPKRGQPYTGRWQKPRAHGVHHSPQPTGHPCPASRIPALLSLGFYILLELLCQKQQQEWKVWDLPDGVNRAAMKCPKAAELEVNSGPAFSQRCPRACRGFCWHPFISC